MHADACASRRHHGRDLFEREHRHALKERRDLGMLVDLAFAHVQKLRAAGDEQRQHPTLFMLGVFAVQVLPVVLNETQPGHFVQQLLQGLAFHLRQLHQLLDGLGLADTHFQCHVRHLIGHQRIKAPVLGVVRRGLEADAVCDHAAELEDVFARSVRAGNFEIQFTLVEREIRGLAAVDIAHVPALLFRGVPRACRRAAKISRGDHHLSYPSSILQENVGFFH